MAFTASPPHLSAKSPKITGVLRLSSPPMNTFPHKRDWITSSCAGKAFWWRFHALRVGNAGGGLTSHRNGTLYVGTTVDLPWASVGASGGRRRWLHKALWLMSTGLCWAPHKHSFAKTT